jgi:glycosyltransferase involved in cell wall biosynthesis
MKILYLVTKSNYGGAQKYVHDLAVAFAAKNHDVAVAFGGNGELARKLNEAHIRTISLDSLVRDINLIKELRSSYGIFRLIKNEKPDVFHVNSSKAGGLGSFFGRLLGVKNVVFTVHGAPFREDRKWYIRSFFYFFTWVTCLLAHKVIAVSKQDEHDLGRMFFVRKKVTTIYPGIVFDGNWERTTPKTRTTNILTVAELHPNKGYLYGLQAFENLHKQGLPIHYTIFGEGDDRKKIEEYISMKGLETVVTLRGYGPPTRNDWANHDVFLLPSIKEGLPYTLIEAGRAMLPVISSITGGIPEVIRHEETGLLVTPKDVTRLTGELKRLVTDRKFAKSLGQSLHAHVAQNFSYSKMLVETSKVYGLIDKSNNK